MKKIIEKDTGRACTPWYLAKLLITDGLAMRWCFASGPQSKYSFGARLNMRFIESHEHTTNRDLESI